MTITAAYDICAAIRGHFNNDNAAAALEVFNNLTGREQLTVFKLFYSASFSSAHCATITPANFSLLADAAAL